MQTLPLKGLVLIRDIRKVSGLPLWTHYLRKALDANYHVDLLLFLHLKRDLPPGMLDPSHIHNGRLRGWELALREMALEEVAKEIGCEGGEAGKLAMFVDCLNFPVEAYGVAETCSFLHRMLHGGRFTAVIALVTYPFEEDSPLRWRQLASLASSTLELSAHHDNDGGSDAEKPLCRTVTYKRRDDSKTERVEEFEVVASDDGRYTLRSAAFKPTSTFTNKHSGAPKPATESLSLASAVPFDMGLELSERERVAKASLQLPYTAVQQKEKGLVGLNISSGKKLRVGGQIVYVPDREDDFDESDPDDDLTI